MEQVQLLYLNLHLAPVPLAMVQIRFLFEHLGCSLLNLGDFWVRICLMNFAQASVNRHFLPILSLLKPHGSATFNSEATLPKFQGSVHSGF